MNVCQSCGGIIGRDCFNPQECMEITREQTEMSPQQTQEIMILQAQLAAAEKQEKELMGEITARKLDAESWKLRYDRGKVAVATAEKREKGLKDAIKKSIDDMEQPPVQAEGDWQTGMFCGLEDVSITDRYDACMFGHTAAIDKVQEWIIDPLEQALKENK